MNRAFRMSDREIGETDALAMAEAVVLHLFGSKPTRVVPLGGGLTNLVFEVIHPDGDFVVRMGSCAAKINDFLKEQWAMARARDVGVPTAEVLEVGCEAISTPYMVARKVEGSEATHHPERLKILNALGHLTRAIHTVPTSGFGRTFDWSKNQLSRNETWAAYLADELKVDERIELLEKHRVLPKPQAEALRETFAEIETWAVFPALNHGDLRLKNVLVDNTGTITALIDWEFCTSNIAPQWDLSLALHDLSIDGKQEFITGYGLPEAEVRAIAPALRAFNLINYAPYVAEAATSGDTDRLERYRTRFGGALDLFAW